jgi:hypothetical protein
MDKVRKPNISEKQILQFTTARNKFLRLLSSLVVAW